MLQKDGDDAKYDPIKLASSYLERNVGGCVDVRYRQKHGKGRYCALKGLSLQIMKKQIRHSISSKYYVDVDCVNCHPIILQYLCKRIGATHTCLTEYINNREEILRSLPVKRDVGKKLFLSLTNGVVNQKPELLGKRTPLLGSTLFSWVSGVIKQTYI